MINALTFDVEEYFHAEVFSGVVPREEWPGLESRVVRATHRILDVLAEGRTTAATFFVLGWVAARHPELVRMIHARGHEVACHGYSHQMITRQSSTQFAEDVLRAKKTLEDTIGAAVIGYRAPTFSVVRETLWSLEVLVESGFRYDSSIFPIVHDRYGIPTSERSPHRVTLASGAEIAEFPLSTVTVLGWRIPVAGGGYFRLFPYRVTQWAIRRINEREGQPAVVYLHPWEMDPGQPRLPVARVDRWRHSVNSGAVVDRLRRVIRDFQFAPVRDVLAGSGILEAGGIA
jgi:polysaccharide deacetylase family protein (PEP-CTERM system associated)